MSLRPLLDYLATQPGDGHWNDWHIQRIAGGANGLVYRATGKTDDFAVKFALRDERHRAEREYEALLALRQAGLDIAPAPIFIDNSRYPQDVVVQSWLEGEVVQSPPGTDREWQHLIEHFAAIHGLRPDSVSQPLKPAVLNCATPDAGKAVVAWQINHLPSEECPAELLSLWQRLQSHQFPDWGESPVRLVRGDPNTLNIIRREDQWASVDWENSGWGDPAFEIADMMIHPAYIVVPLERWNWVVDTYTQLRDDSAAEQRIRAYYHMMAVWWVARLARYLYEIPLGLDQRLVEHPADWQAPTLAKYEHYRQLAENLTDD